MKYQKIINLLDNTSNQPFNFRTKNWVKINNKLRGNHDSNNDIKFETSMIRTSLCGYRMHTYMLKEL